MKRTFIEFATVTKVLWDNGVDAERIRETQIAIMRGSGDTVVGTGGLKKIRCGATGRGKSGGVRIVFADYPEAGYTIWLMAFPKNVQGNLSAAETQDLRKTKAYLDKLIRNRGVVS